MNNSDHSQIIFFPFRLGFELIFLVVDQISKLYLIITIDVIFPR